MSDNYLPSLRVSQPYTMCHALRLVDPQVDCGILATPVLGTNQAMDRPDVLVLLCLTAPVAVQRAARAQGVTGVLTMRVPGLAEALQRARAGVQDSQGVILPPAVRASVHGWPPPAAMTSSTFSGSVVM